MIVFVAGGCSQQKSNLERGYSDPHESPKRHSNKTIPTFPYVMNQLIWLPQLCICGIKTKPMYSLWPHKKYMHRWIVPWKDKNHLQRNLSWLLGVVMAYTSCSLYLCVDSRLSTVYTHPFYTKEISFKVPKTHAIFSCHCHLYTELWWRKTWCP